MSFIVLFDFLSVCSMIEVMEKFVLALSPFPASYSPSLAVACSLGMCFFNCTVGFSVFDITRYCEINSNTNLLLSKYFDKIK